MNNKIRLPFRAKRKHRSGEPLHSRLLRRVRGQTSRRRQLTITNRFEVGMILSEIVTGFLFIAGSISMFYSPRKSITIVLYLIGSIMMLLRSGLRASYWFRLKSMDQKGTNTKDETADNGDWSR
ncbi:YrhK family protein [Paenibacillus dakarensis]|uniref:YrhK family protein n=1 Tax=Paenibacillus dakarensis TaxID=1527293 RepID=UPI0006D57ACF|nr:YrhK family protein [Paenibacillus dakarensis]